MSKKKDADEIADLVRAFVATYQQDKPTMLDILADAAPLLKALSQHGNISDDAMLALTQRTRSLCSGEHDAGRDCESGPGSSGALQTPF